MFRRTPLTDEQTKRAGLSPRRRSLFASLVASLRIFVSSMRRTRLLNFRFVRGELVMQLPAMQIAPASVRSNSVPGIELA